MIFREDRWATCAARRRSRRPAGNPFASLGQARRDRVPSRGGSGGLPAIAPGGQPEPDDEPCLLHNKELRSAEGRRPSRGEAGLQHAGGAFAQARQRRSRPHLVQRGPRQLRGRAHRHRPRARPGQVFHHHPQPSRRWRVVVAEQHARALQRRPVPPRHAPRQRAAPADDGARSARHRSPEARRRLVDGWMPDLSMGRPISRHDGQRRANVLLGPHGLLQQGVPAVAPARPGTRPGLRQRLLHRTPARRP